jgi:polar amino acid transport system permease protein
MADWLSMFSRYFPDFIQGTRITIQITLVGLGLGLLTGLPAALIRVYGGKWFRWLSVGYIELFRGTPILVQLFVVYFGLPDFGITFSRITAAYLALGLNSGAYQAEYFRSAIQAISGGQMMAARAIGMSRFQAIRHVILPQALRLVIPSWANEPVALMKASAVAFLIAVPDLMTRGKFVAARTYDPIGAYLAVAVFYIVMVFSLTVIVNFVERRTRIPGMETSATRV